MKECQRDQRTGSILCSHHSCFTLLLNTFKAFPLRVTDSLVFRDLPDLVSHCFSNFTSHCSSNFTLHSSPTDLLTVPRHRTFVHTDAVDQNSPSLSPLVRSSPFLQGPDTNLLVAIIFKGSLKEVLFMCLLFLCTSDFYHVITYSLLCILFLCAWKFFSYWMWAPRSGTKLVFFSVSHTVLSRCLIYTR